MVVDFMGEVWYWRGPAPFYFVTVPSEASADIKQIAGASTYGWGMIPVDVRIGETTWYTALFPKDGLYVLPLKDRVRKAERIEEGAIVSASLQVRLRNEGFERGRG